MTHSVLVERGVIAKRSGDVGVQSGDVSRFPVPHGEHAMAADDPD
jgi:hypothetical protein